MKDSFLLIGLPLLLCLVPLIVTLSSWHLEHSASPALSNFRRASFRAGLLLSLLGSLVTASCWVDPYPLVHTPDGGISIAWLDRAWTVSFVTPIISMSLALFGRRRPRVLLLVSDLLTLVLAYGSLLQNGI